MSWDLRSASMGALAGVLAGCLVTLALVALVWPDSQVNGAAGTPVPTVSVPPLRPTPPTVTGVPQPTPSDEVTDEAEDEDDDDWPPSEAEPLADAAPAGEGRLPDASPVSCPRR